MSPEVGKMEKNKLKLDKLVYDAWMEASEECQAELNNSGGEI